MYRMRTPVDFIDKSNKKKEYNQCEGTTRLGRCVVDVNDRQASYSKLFYKKNLCFNCQKELKGGEQQ